MMCGGFGSEKQVNETVIQICNEVKESIENSLNAKYNVFEPVKYKSQVVAGTNYKVKIKVDEGYVHAKIHQALSCNGGNVNIMEVSGGHTEDTAL